MERLPLSPYGEVAARTRIRSAEHGWNGRDQETVAFAYMVGSVRRNGTRFQSGHDEIIAFLKRKWARELGDRLIRELCTFAGHRIAVRFT